MIPKKVAIFTHGIEGGTFTNIGTALTRGFKELGVSCCDLVVLNATNEEKAKYPDVNVVSLNVTRASFSLLPLVRYIRKEKPDVIFPMPWYFNVIAIWARNLSLTNTKIIVGEQNIISLEAGIEHRDKLRLKYLPVVMRYTYPYGDGIIGVAQDVITDLVKEVKVSTRIPMTVIFNPVDVSRVQQLAKEPIDHPWFQNHNVPVIVTAARLAKQKRLDILIRAFARVVDVVPAKLLILGQGPLRAELENLCKELQIEEHVDMPGFDSNPCRFMSACDVFVLASAWEGSPVALAEALASGAAVIVNDATGGSKDIIEYGKYGMMVPTGDHDALAKSIIQVLTDTKLKSHYQEQSLSRSQDLQALKISKQYLDFYNSVLVSKSGN